MSKDSLLSADKLMRMAPVIPILVMEGARVAPRLAQALVDGGLAVIEVTLRTAAALEAIAVMASTTAMATRAGLADYIHFKVGDAVQLIGELYTSFDFVLLDLWKDLYVPCLEAFYPKLKPGAIIVADNMIRPGNEDVLRYGRSVRAKPWITSVLLPVGSGIEISRFEPAECRRSASGVHHQPNLHVCRRYSVAET